MASLRTNFFVKIALVAVIVFFIISAVDLRNRLDSLNREKETLMADIIELYDDIEMINIRLEVPMTMENIEKIAREELGYRDTDERIFYNDWAD